MISAAVALISAAPVLAKSQATEESFAGIPLDFQGKFDLEWKGCRGDSDGRMELSADTISYLDERGSIDLSASVRSVIQTSERAIIVQSKYLGRQQHWLEIDGFSLSADGNSLDRITAATREKPQSKIRYVRCPAVRADVK